MMSEYEYRKRIQELEERRAEMEKERAELKRARIKNGFAQALKVAGLDASWSDIVAVESESEYPRLIGELQARGVIGTRNLNLEGIGKRLGAIEREVEEKSTASEMYFGRTSE